MLTLFKNHLRYYLLGPAIAVAIFLIFFNHGDNVDAITITPTVSLQMVTTTPNPIAKAIIPAATLSTLNLTPNPTVSLNAHAPANHRNSPLVTQPISPPLNNSTQALTQTITIQKGDTIGKILTQLKVSRTDQQKILQLSTAKSQLLHLQPGKSLTIQRNTDQSITQISYPFSDLSTLIINRHNLSYQSQTINQPLETHLAYQSFTVNRSLLVSIHRTGLSPILYAQLLNIFKTATNLRQHFTRQTHVDLIYEEHYIHNKKYRPGNILLISLDNPHGSYQAVRYTNPKNQVNYYTPLGDGLQPSFLAAPLHYKRISSEFSFHRFDPVVHMVRPHLGTDFAAPIGTPVQSISDGIVTFAGTKGGYGNAVVVAYGKEYKALFAHLGHFAPSIHSGSTVKKGQTIGYVGMSGWTTGPHLHFGWYAYGIPRDPLKYIPLNSTAPIPSQYRKDFLHESRTLIAALNLHKDTQLAVNNTWHDNTIER